MREKITPERGLVPGSGVRFDSMGDRNGGGRNYSPTLFPTLFPTSNPPRFIPWKSREEGGFDQGNAPGGSVVLP